MTKAEELKILTRHILGDRPGVKFYSKVDHMLEDGEGTNASLISATRNIERMVKLFVGVEQATSLAKLYKEFFKKNPSYL